MTEPETEEHEPVPPARRAGAALLLAVWVCLLGFCAVWVDRSIDFVIKELLDARATNALGAFYAKGLLVGVAGALKYLALPLLLVAAFFYLVFDRGPFALGTHLGVASFEDNTLRTFKVLLSGVVVAVVAFVVGIPLLGAIALVAFRFPAVCAGLAVLGGIAWSIVRRRSR
jgi:hypothetical protein